MREEVGMSRKREAGSVRISGTRRAETGEGERERKRQRKRNVLKWALIGLDTSTSMHVKNWKYESHFGIIFDLGPRVSFFKLRLSQIVN